MACLAADRLNKGGLMGDSLTGEGKRGKAGDSVGRLEYKALPHH